MSERVCELDQLCGWEMRTGSRRLRCARSRRAMVGATGIEPVTSSASRKRSSPELSAPILMSCEATTGIEPV